MALRETLPIQPGDWESLSQYLAQTMRVINVMDPLYGAKGDGVTNDSTALNAALAAANAGGTVYFPKGTYKLASPLTYTGAGGLAIQFDAGVVIDATGLADGSSAFSFTGTEAAQIPLTANVAIGASSITFAAGGEAGISAGDYIRVGSTAKWTPNVSVDGSMDQRIGEICRVASTGSGTITFANPLNDGYLTADTAFFSKITMVDSIEITGKAKLLGKGSGGAQGVHFDRCAHVNLRGLRLYNCDDVHVMLDDVVDAVIEKLHIEGGTSVQGTFYAVKANYSTQDVMVRGNHVESCRHSFTTGGALARSGIVRRIVVRDCVSLNATAASFDSHAGCDGIVFDGCYSYGAGGAGVQLRNPRGKVIGCTIVNPGDSGIYLRNQSDRSTDYEVIGNTVRGGTNSFVNGILYRTPQEAALAGTTAGQAVDAVVIQGNTVIDPQASGINCQATAGFSNLESVIVTGNRVKWSSLSAQTGISFARITDSVIAGNVVKNAAVGMSLDNNCVTCTHAGNIFTSCTTRRTMGTGAGHTGDAPDVVTTTPFPAQRNGTLVYPIASQAQYYRVWGRGRITAIGLHVAIQSGNIDVGVYRNANVGPNAVPGVRLSSSGSVACPAAGYQTVALGAAVEVEPGDWIAISCDNAVASFGTLATAGQTSNVGLGSRYTQATAFPLPNPAASLIGFAGNVYLLTGA